MGTENLFIRIVLHSTGPGSASAQPSSCFQADGNCEHPILPLELLKTLEKDLRPDMAHPILEGNVGLGRYFARAAAGAETRPASMSSVTLAPVP